MFSAFKRLAGKGDGQQGVSGMPPGHQTMSTQLQRKFARGIQYNMKVIIKGDRNVGKTCLFNRLQGKKFIEEYIPTDEIQVTSIQWNYKATDDIVKVEIWDVVDRGKKKKHFDGLKLDNTQLEISEEPALDAEFLDVYKGTNGVIIMMDITKSWTFDYVQKELPKVPEHIPVIVLANHCDMAHHRTVTQTQISFFVESMQNRASQVRYTESSMRNGFGLKLLHKFFNLPFLQLQRVSLLQQLERNKTEIDLTCQELDMYFESDEADYNKFIDQLSSRRRQVAELHSPRPITTTLETPSSIVSGNNTPTGEMRHSQSTPIFIGAGHPIPASGIKNTSTLDIDKLSQAPKLLNSTTLSDTKINTSFSSDSAFNKTNDKNEQSFMSKIFGNKQLQTKDNTNDVRGTDVAKLASNLNSIVSVDEFCPDGGQLDKSFLEDIVEKNDSVEKSTYEALDSDSDAETGNPLVAGFQDDIVPDEFNITEKQNIIEQPQLQTINKNKVQSIEEQSNRNSNSIISDSENNQLHNEFSNKYFTPVSNSDAIDTWLSTDSKWRRSPEGGEDVSVAGQSLDYSGSSVTNDDTGSITSFNISASLLDSTKKNSKANSTEKLNDKKDKKRSEYKSEKKHKHKKSDTKEKDSSSKDKEKKRSSKKKRSRDETCDRLKEHNKRDELEEFLNGPGDIEENSVEAAYEAF